MALPAHRTTVLACQEMASSQHPPPGLIGRDRELSALAEALDAADDGRMALLIVEGPSGIGKTALVQHFLAAHPALLVREACGVAWESHLPYRIAEQLARACGAGPAELTTSASPAEAGRRLYELWEPLQREQTLAIVIDDSHWADLESLRAVRSALRSTPEARILLVLIAADDALQQLPAATVEFLDSVHDHTLRPRPLDAQEVKAFAHQAAGLVLPLPTARHLARHTRGNPLHIGQLLREVPPETWHDWQPALPAPERFAISVRQRLEGCAPETRTLVEACALFEPDTTLTRASALAGLDDALPSVDEACEAGLLRSTTAPGRVTLDFPHPLTRAAVLSTLGLARTRALHRAAAHVVEDPGQRLTHRVAASEGPDPELADELDRYAGERAAAGEWATVSGLLVKASRLSPDPALRRQRLLRGVDAMTGAGDVPQALTFAAELESFPAGTLRDAVLGYLALVRGRSGEAEALLTRAWERCDPRRSPDLAAMVSQRWVLHALGRWDGAQLVAWARRALELVDPEDPSAVESEAIMGLGLAAQGRPELGLAAYEKAIAHAADDAQTQRFQMGRGWLDLALDNPEDARRRLSAAVPTVFRAGSTRISLWAQGWLARTQFAMGGWAEALDTADRAAAHLSQARIELVRPLIHWTAAQINALRGDWDAADHYVGEASVGVHHYEVMLLPACLARAQVAEARADYQQVLEALAPVARLDRQDIDEPGFWPWYDVYANALVMTGRTAEADRFLSPHEDRARQRGHRSALARVGLVRGRIAGARGEVEEARRHFEAALSQLDLLPLPYDRARVDFAFGQTLRRAGKRRDADTVLRRARDAFAQLGALTYVERCRRELNAGGLHTSSAPSSRLTAQEQAVARLVADGATNRDTATQLFISVKTVQYHLTHIYSKLGIRSRSELAASFRNPDTPG